MVLLSLNTNVNVEFVTVLSTDLPNLKLQLPPLRKTKLTKNILVLSQTKSLKKTETSKFGFTIGWVCSSEFIPIIVRRRRQRWKTHFDVWFLVTLYQFTHHAFLRKSSPRTRRMTHGSKADQAEISIILVFWSHLFRRKVFSLVNENLDFKKCYL